MSKPVPISPDCSRHEIRNTHGGVEFFLPHLMIRLAFQFILATASRRYNIGIVAYAMMPTHIHILVRVQLDPTKPYDLGGFKRFVNSTMAQFINVYWEERRDRGGSVFCKDSIGQSIKILDEASDEETIAYIETNGLSAGIGATPACMKGAVSLRKWVTKPLKVTRPPIYFSERSWKETEELQLCVPRQFEERGVSRSKFQKRTTRLVKEATKAIIERRQEQGLSARPLSDWENKRPEFPTKHSVAGHGRAWMKGSDPAEKAREYEELRTFHEDHASSLELLRNGDREVVFPAGTYKAARVYGVRVCPGKGRQVVPNVASVVKQE